MNSTEHLPAVTITQTAVMELALQPQVADVELWDESSVFDDDSLAAAHEDAAVELLEMHVRTETEQSTRDDLAAKALGVIISAAESPFSDAARQMALVNQLVSRIGHLCSGEEVQKIINSHNHMNHESDTYDEAQASTAEQKWNRQRDKKTSQSTRKRTGSLMQRPLFGELRRLLMPFVG